MTTAITKKGVSEKDTYEYGILLNNVTVTTTSREVQCFGAKKAVLRFVRTLHTSGNAVHIVEATMNGVDWFTYNMLIDNVANTNAQNLTRVAGKTLSSNSEAQVSLDLLNFPVLEFRTKSTITTDGTSYVEFYLER